MSDVPRHQLTPIELAIERAMRQDRINRRAFLGRAGRGGIALGAMLSLPALIAACTPSGSGDGDVTLELGSTGRPTSTSTRRSEPNPTIYPTINAFIEQTGINVEYNEELLDNADFFAADPARPVERQPHRMGPRSRQAAGWSSGWRTWATSRKSTTASCPNWTANAADYAVGQWYDPDNTYSVWWQGGITGIAYDPNLTGRELTSFDDLLDPEFAGGVGAFSDMRDMFGLTLLSLGIVPENATIDDVTAAQQKLLEANGREPVPWLLRQRVLTTRWPPATSWPAWHGPATSPRCALREPERQVRDPRGGGMRWNDNMCIPKGSTERIEQTLTSSWTTGTTSTPATHAVGVHRRTSPAWRASASGSCRMPSRPRFGRRPRMRTSSRWWPRRIVPTEEQIDNTYTDKQLDEEEEAEWNDLFLEVLGG